MKRIAVFILAACLAVQASALPPFMLLMMNGKVRTAAGTGGGTPFSVVHATGFKSTSSSAFPSITIPAATAGNVLVLTCASDTTVSSITGFTQQSPANVSGQGQYFYTKLASGGETSIAVTLGSSDCLTAVVYELAGVTSITVDKSAVNNPVGGTSVASGTTATLTQANEYCIASICWNSTLSTGITVSSYSNSYVGSSAGEQETTGSTVNVHLAVGVVKVTATTAQSTTATLTSSVSNPQTLLMTFLTN